MQEATVHFDEVEDILAQAKALLGAAEAHGIQVGLLCASAALASTAERISLLLRELECGEQEWRCRALFVRLENVAQQSLQGLNFNFKPLIPNDDNDLAERLAGLSAWCRGFLYGLGLGGMQESQLQNSIIEEALHDMNQIAYGDLGEGSNKGTEDDWIQVLEYVRIAVQTIHMESQAPAVQSGLDAIH
jgi:uncharacterized protein YgfB (UPF0149 family)